MKQFDEIKFKGQIIHSAPTYLSDVGRLHLLLQEALECLHESVHGDDVPTKEEQRLLEYSQAAIDRLRKEQQVREDRYAAADRLERIAGNIYLALTGKNVCRSREGRYEARTLHFPWNEQLQNAYETALDEIQASIVLAGGSKPSHADLEASPLGRSLASWLRNGIKIRTLYVPKPEELR